jgi:hypothetical protein
MHKKPSAYFKLLMGLFSAEEIALLQQQAHFHFALACVHSFNDFDRFCVICRRLLARHEARAIAA